MLKKILSLCITLVFPHSHLQKYLKRCSFLEFQTKLTPRAQTKSRMFHPFYYKDPFVRDCILELKERNSHDVTRLFGEILAGWIVREISHLNEKSISVSSLQTPQRYFCLDKSKQVEQESSLYFLDPRLRGDDVVESVRRDDVVESVRRDDVLTKSNFYLTPIPQHISKTKEKGFCHTTTLATAIYAHIKNKYPNIPLYIFPCIIKNRKSKQLHITKGKKKRFSMIKNTMSAHITKQDMKNSYFFILDDVYTTGATFKEARRSLKDCGVPEEHIFFVSIAH